MAFRILAVYPRKTATRIGLFHGRDEILRREIQHDRAELMSYPHISDQWSHRLRALEELLGEGKILSESEKIDAVIGPAGLPERLPAGVYIIDKDLLARLKRAEANEHHSDLGAPLAESLARPRKAAAYALASLSSEEFDPISKVTGIPELSFGRMLHTLNIKEVAYRAAEDLQIPYENLSIVIAYLGKSFSICSQSGGRVLDLANANERGPFSPARSGAVPATEMIRMSYSGLWSRDMLLSRISTNGGMESYMGTDNLIEVAKRATLGDMYAGLVIRSMAYQIAQEIAAQATVLRGDVDAIILTGGCARDNVFVEILKERISWICDTILVYPGVDELVSLASAALRILQKQEVPRKYADETAVLR